LIVSKTTEMLLILRIAERDMIKMYS
jgi:hypothetical protein